MTFVGGTRSPGNFIIIGFGSSVRSEACGTSSRPGSANSIHRVGSESSARSGESLVGVSSIAGHTCIGSSSVGIICEGGVVCVSSTWSRCCICAWPGYVGSRCMYKPTASIHLKLWIHYHNIILRLSIFGISFDIRPILYNQRVQFCFKLFSCFSIMKCSAHGTLTGALDKGLYV